MSFHPGQRVVCVDAAPTREGRVLNALTKGTVYTVRWAGMHDSPLNGRIYGIRLEEIHRGVCPVHGRVDTPYNSRRFRPLDESRLDVFRAHLVTPPKQKVKALAP